LDPDARDPVIIGIVTPVAWGPNIAFGWGVGLLIYRYRGWRDPNRYADLCKRRRQRKPYKEQRRERNGRNFHFHIQGVTVVQRETLLRREVFRYKSLRVFIEAI